MKRSPWALLFLLLLIAPAQARRRGGGGWGWDGSIDSYDELAVVALIVIALMLIALFGELRPKGKRPWRPRSKDPISPAGQATPQSRAGGLIQGRASMCHSFSSSGLRRLLLRALGVVSTIVLHEFNRTDRRPRVGDRR